MYRRSPLAIVMLFSILTLFFSCRGDESANDSWKYVGPINDEKGASVQVYMDVANMEISGNKRKFWIKYVAGKEGQGGSPEQYIRQTGYWEIDCFDRSLFRLAEEYYSPGGEVLGKTEKRVREEYSSYESLGAQMSDVACRYAGK